MVCDASSTAVMLRRSRQDFQMIMTEIRRLNTKLLQYIERLCYFFSCLLFLVVLSGKISSLTNLCLLIVTFSFTWIMCNSPNFLSFSLPPNIEKRERVREHFFRSDDFMMPERRRAAAVSCNGFDSHSIRSPSRFSADVHTQHFRQQQQGVEGWLST